MKNGFLKVCTLSPALRVADCAYNTQETIAAMQQAAQDGAALAVFPELGLTGYTCSDLFLQQPLLDALQRQGLADEILLWEAFSRMRTIDWGRENATATGTAAGDRERSGVL